MRTALAVALAVLALAPAIAGPATAPGRPPASSSPPELRPVLVLDIPVRAAAFGTKFYEETARQFEKTRPDVRVRIYGDPRIEDKVRIRIIDGHLPDATFAPYLLWPALIQAGKVRDLSAALNGRNWEGDQRWRDTFLPGALDAWTVDRGIYGIPLGYACWTLFYNRGLFRAHGWSEPRTWDEFFALCHQIGAAGIAPVALTGVYGNYPDAFLRAAYFNLAGAEGWRQLHVLAPGARIDPRYVRAAALLQQVTQTCTLRGWEGMTHTAAQLAFLEGRAAMTVSGSWMIHEMEGKIPAAFELGVMNFPVFADGVADPSTIQTGADCFFAFATGDLERERATVDFLRFLTSRERARAFVAELDSPVAVRGVPRETYRPELRSTIAMIERARAAFDMPQVMLQPPSVRQALVDQRLALMTGRITPQQFGEKMEAAAARDRLRAARPDFVETRHPRAATALLTLLAAAVVWLLARRLPGRLFRKHDSDTEAHGEAFGGEENAESEGFFLGRLQAGPAAFFVGPAFALYAALVLLPGAASFVWAFQHWDGLSGRTWAGLFNFRWLFLESDVFWTALGNNLFLMLVPAAIVVPLALFFAALISRGVAGANLFRACFLFPNILGGVAATLLWLNAYEPHGGLINACLSALGRALHVAWLQNFDGFPWLAQSHLYGALLPIYLWTACGFNLVLYLAAMESVPAELYEAAELEGASPLRQFFTITLPLIWEVVVISAVFLVIGGLNAFEMIWLLTAQDPASGSHTLGTLMVSTMFKEFAMGRATAIAVVLFLLVFLGTAVVRRALRRDVVEM